MTPINARADAREQRIVDETIQLIDYASRVFGAVEHGNWRYAADKLPGLATAVNDLARQINLNHADELQLIRGGSVWVKVSDRARSYWLGRLLFPRAKQDGGPTDA